MEATENSNWIVSWWRWVWSRPRRSTVSRNSISEIDEQTADPLPVQASLRTHENHFNLHQSFSAPVTYEHFFFDENFPPDTDENLTSVPNVINEIGTANDPANEVNEHDGQDSEFVTKNPMMVPRTFQSMLKVLPVDDEDVVGTQYNDIVLNSSSEDGLDEPLRTVNFVGLEGDLKNELPEDDWYRLVGWAENEDNVFTPYGFIIMCIFLIAWGIIGVLLTITLSNLKIDAIEFLIIDKDFTTHPPLYLFIATSLSILSGIVGIIALMYDKPFLIGLIPHCLWVVSVFAIAAGITAIGSIRVPTKSTYLRLFEAVVTFKEDPTYLRDGWPGIKPDIWDRIQKTMQCCGLDDPTDWLRAPQKNISIPLSCCSVIVSDCQTRIQDWMFGKTSFEEFNNTFNEIRTVIYEKSCIHVLTLERAQRIRDWAAYPALLVVLQFPLMIYVNYLCYSLLMEYRSWEGIIRLAIFRSTETEIIKGRLKVAFWSIVGCKCCKKGVNEEEPHPVQTKKLNRKRSNTKSKNFVGKKSTTTGAKLRSVKKVNSKLEFEDEKANESREKLLKAIDNVCGQE